MGLLLKSVRAGGIGPAKGYPGFAKDKIPGPWQSFDLTRD